MQDAGPVILFDGVCNFCSAAVDFVLARDAGAVFRFAPLQSPTGQALLKKHGLHHVPLSTLVLVDGDHAYVRSTAALRVAAYLGAPWRVLGWVLWWVPRPLRDAVYSVVAQHRYRVMGRAPACRVPQPHERARFLEP